MVYYIILQQKHILLGATLLFLAQLITKTGQLITRSVGLYIIQSMTVSRSLHLSQMDMLLSVAVMIERWKYYRSAGRDLAGFRAELRTLVGAGRVDEAFVKAETRRKSQEQHSARDLETHQAHTDRIKQELPKQREKKQNSASCQDGPFRDLGALFRVIAACQSQENRHGADWIDNHKESHEDGKKMDQH